MIPTIKSLKTKIEKKISEIQAMQKSTPDEVDYILFRKLQILKEIYNLIKEYLKV